MACMMFRKLYKKRVDIPDVEDDLRKLVVE
jgi:hypothetical protein